MPVIRMPCNKYSKNKMLCVWMWDIPTIYTSNCLDLISYFSVCKENSIKKFFQYPVLRGCGMPPSVIFVKTAFRKLDV